LIELAAVAQAVAIIGACWAILSGVDAWKREFIGKRRIELAENLLAKFFEIKDAVRYIRNPFGSSAEGKSRERDESESRVETQMLDRGYVVAERYAKKETIFAEFSTLKYRCMAAFGSETESIFTETYRTVNSIVWSARMLAIHYWKHEGHFSPNPEVYEKHLEDMKRHEGVFWDDGSETDEIRVKLQRIQEQLESVTAPCFQESMKLYSVLANPLKWPRGRRHGVL
jgi:hypothetical protein